MLVSLYRILMPTRRSEKAGSQFSGLIPGLCQLKCQSATCRSKPDEYIERSPLHHVEDLNIPILVHVATNDQDVNYVEDQQLVWKLRALKPDLAGRRFTSIPRPGGASVGHAFSRRVDPRRSSASTRRRRSIPGIARECSSSGGCGRTRIGRSRRPRWRLGRAKAYYLLLY